LEHNLGRELRSRSSATRVLAPKPESVHAGKKSEPISTSLQSGISLVISTPSQAQSTPTSKTHTLDSNSTSTSTGTPSDESDSSMEVPTAPENPSDVKYLAAQFNDRIASIMRSGQTPYPFPYPAGGLMPKASLTRSASAPLVPTDLPKSDRQLQRSLSYASEAHVILASDA
jgi:hypothetical protein